MRALKAFPMATYTNWMVCYTRKRKWSSVCPWTFGQLKEMCQLLAEELPGCRFAPEPICGGGVEFMDWPGKMPREYKSFRLHADSYPFISDDTPDSADFNVFRDTEFFMTLKAFHGAPRFNVSELQAFQKVMQQVVGLPSTWHMTVVSDRLLQQLHRESVSDR